MDCFSPPVFPASIVLTWLHSLMQLWRESTQILLASGMKVVTREEHAAVSKTTYLAANARSLFVSKQIEKQLKCTNFSSLTSL